MATRELQTWMVVFLGKTNMKNIKRFLYIATALCLRSPFIYGTPEPYELQQAAEKIRQSVLGDCTDPTAEIERAMWDMPDGISANGLKLFFPEECRDFRIMGSFRYDAYIVRTRFTYVSFPFLCVFIATFNTPSLKKELFCFRTMRLMCVCFMDVGFSVVDRI